MNWSRIPGRLVLLVAFLIGVAGFAFANYPFDTASDSGATLHCGPPLFEVIVPPDPNFDVPENEACAGPAKLRLVVAGGAVLAAFAGAAAAELRARRSTHVTHVQWLRGPASKGRAGAV